MHDPLLLYAAPARHCLVASWSHRHWVCVKTHRDPPPLSTHPSKIGERAGLPSSFQVSGQGLEPRTFYEFLSDMPFACDFVSLDGWVLDDDPTHTTFGLPLLESFVVFDHFPNIYEAGKTPALPHRTDIGIPDVFTDVGGNASFTLTVDGCVKRVYNIHLVSLSPQGTEFSTKENITVP